MHLIDYPVRPGPLFDSIAISSLSLARPLIGSREAAVEANNLIFDSIIYIIRIRGRLSLSPLHLDFESWLFSPVYLVFLDNVHSCTGQIGAIDPQMLTKPAISPSNLTFIQSQLAAVHDYLYSVEAAIIFVPSVNETASAGCAAAYVL